MNQENMKIRYNEFINKIDIKKNLYTTVFKTYQYEQLRQDNSFINFYSIAIIY